MHEPTTRIGSTFKASPPVRYTPAQKHRLFAGDPVANLAIACALAMAALAVVASVAL